MSPSPTPTAAPAEDRAWLLAQAARERDFAAEYDVMLAGYLRADWPEKAREVEQYAADHLALAARYDRLAGMCDAYVVKAIERGQQDGGFVLTYTLPTGPIHRAIPLLQELGITVRPGFDGRKDLTPEQQVAVAGFVHEMQENVIPEVVARQQRQKR